MSTDTVISVPTNGQPILSDTTDAMPTSPPDYSSSNSNDTNLSEIPSDVNGGSQDFGETRLKRIKHFVDDLNKASQYIVAPRQIYSNIIALVVHWDESISDRPHIGKNAQDLCKLLEDEYGFDVGSGPFKIPEERAQSKFVHELIARQNKLGGKKAEKNLSILYYGGHAELKDNLPVWRSRQSGHRNGTLKWHECQTYLEDFESDIVMIFDCCYGGSMIDQTFDRNFNRNCEILMASAEKKKASGLKNFSFTAAVVDALREEGKERQGCDMRRLHVILSNKSTGLKVYPYYAWLSRPMGPSIRLTSMRPSHNASDSKFPRTPPRPLAESDARVLMKVTFEDPTENPDERKQEFEGFLQWRPGNLLEVQWGAGKEQEVMMHGFFKTESSSAIISMPMELWDSLPQRAAYEFLSVIRSGDQRMDILKPETSCMRCQRRCDTCRHSDSER
ncbi:hypothetical protein F4821DRAFT_251064 [Hypoxylon rubiginosum]|uniref:Uncharacterized protein n=1 Tax=Hypoxylon rubiginosum TaxID=110542 RepID=A0ACC0CJU6_9PEZI|nr:hypothetical protein F4821DRAFT_251064 [Hypoxylon rubiginosum]